jgi:hypothetical protein
MMNPPEEWLFCRELPAHRQGILLFRQELPDQGRGIHRRNGIPPEMYRLKDEKSARGIGFHYNQLMEADSNRQDQKSSKR